MTTYKEALEALYRGWDSTDGTVTGDREAARTAMQTIAHLLQTIAETPREHP